MKNIEEFLIDETKPFSYFQIPKEKTDVMTVLKSRGYINKPQLLNDLWVCYPTDKLEKFWCNICRTYGEVEFLELCLLHRETSKDLIYERLKNYE